MEAFALILPTIYEVWDDRNGEYTKGKKTDLIITACLYAVFALAFWWIFETHPLKSLALMLGIRILLFDYLVQYVLIHNGVIAGHWFNYSGKTARWDKATVRLNPWLKLGFRVLVFVGTIFVYFSSLWTYSAL